MNSEKQQNVTHLGVVPKGLKKIIKVICVVSYFVYARWTWSYYYYVDIKLVLFLDLMSNILFTDTGVL